MWTPKRVAILLGSFVFFTILFGFYFHFLGYLDGLPELPREFWPDSTVRAAPPSTPPLNDETLQKAFGEGCEELSRPIRLFLRTKGLAFAVKKFEILPDGRVKLTPFSAVIYGKNATGSYPEINTIQSEIAFLTLDRPIASLSELGSRKITAVQLVSSDAIKISNNHRTPEMSDDINVRIEKVLPSETASLFYDDSTSLIKTEDMVKMEDRKTFPPTKIEALGMEIQLTREGAGAKGKAGGKGESVNGVEWLLLKKFVDMNLYTDPNSGFMADPQREAGKDANDKSAPGAPAAKSHIVIKTDGSLHYDLIQEIARFKCDPNSQANNEVKVTKVHDDLPGFHMDDDQIKCEDLELHFRQKAAAPVVGGKANQTGDKGGEKEIDTAIAKGKEVHVSMESEKLKAFGTEMFYRSAVEGKGPETRITGQPMYAIKDGHKITAPELHLVGGDKKGVGQHAEAKNGKGQLDMLDHAHPEKPAQHALWRDGMTFVKITKNGILMDLLTLNGDASFVDEERGQTLRAEKLLVWLEPAARGPEPAAASSKNQTPAKNQAQGPLGNSNQKLHRLEAHGKVTYVGPDVHIEGAETGRNGERDCEYLVIDARDKENKALPTPPANAGGSQAALGYSQSGSGAPPGGPVDPVLERMNGNPALGPNAVPLGTEPPQLKKARPIRLWAKEVHVNVLRVGSQNEMENLVAMEDVHVIQEGEMPTDKGVDIQGYMLNLVQDEKGKILYVDGDEKASGAKKLGRLLMNDMELVGPKISINQRDNIAQAEGQGFLNMPSNSNLDGTKTTKPGARMTVHWNRRMEFNGRNANFYGGVMAVQEGSNLRCQELQVTTDREVSFKEGQKDTQAAKVEKIVCLRDVFILERIVDELTKKLVRQQTGQFGELVVDNLDGVTRGYGPGFVASFSKDGGDPKNPKGNTKPAEQTKLTRVEFRGWLFSKTMESTRQSKFYDYVEVYHLPAAHPDVVIDRTKPPKDGFYLRCHLLEVYSRPVNGKNAQLMEAKRQVTFQTDEFFGRADTVKFDESDDVIVFEANPGSMVVINKILPDGTAGQEIRGTKVLYNRKNGAFQVDGGRVIQGRG